MVCQCCSPTREPSPNSVGKATVTSNFGRTSHDLLRVIENVFLLDAGRPSNRFQARGVQVGRAFFRDLDDVPRIARSTCVS